MKTLSASLQTHFEQECFAAAQLWLLVLNFRQAQITGITNANPGRVTTQSAHALTTGDYVILNDVIGMTQVNDVATASTWTAHQVTVIDPTNFDLTADTTAFGTYTSGGVVREIIAFTTWPQNITFDGIPFLADDSFDPSAVKTSSNLGVDNLDADGLVADAGSPGVTLEDIRVGRLDDAELRVGAVNPDDLTMGKMWWRRGWLGTLSRRKIDYTGLLQGMMSLLQLNTGELYSKACRYDLYSIRCTLSPTSFTITSTVTGVTDLRIFQDSSRTEADDHFTFERIVWLTGNNTGLSMEVVTYTLATGEFSLFQKMPNTIQVGDSFTARAGCDKSLDICRDKFDNVINFGGQWHLPGQDALFAILVPQQPRVE